MNIVILDGYTLNPGDLSWDNLKALGECRIYDRTSPDQTVARSAGAEILLTNKTILFKKELEQLPDCRYIGVLATGYNVVDTEFARQKGIPVCNVPAYSTESVAQMTIAHLLNLTQHVAYHAETVKQGCWQKSPDFCYWDFPLLELSGKTMGIIGLGRIGKAVARIALAMGMRVIAHTRSTQTDMSDLERVSLEELYQQSDVISLHCPLTEENEGMINARAIDMMKEGAVLINTSRGQLIDEQALAAALESGKLAGAGLDVLSAEPPTQNNPLIAAPNCHITPHIAWATHASRKRLIGVAVKNVAAFLRGQPQNVVNSLV